jgi:predicted amidohydrolase YtcJ
MRFRFVLGLVCVLVASVVTPGQREFATPDAIFINGKVVTVDAPFSIQQAFAIQADRFVAVGTNERVRALAKRSTRVVDLHGRTVIPGLADNHDHLYDSARIMRRGLSLDGVTSTAEALDRIRRGLAARDGEVVLTTVLRLPGATLSIQELDAISTTVPIVVPRNRLSAWLNTAALRRAGVTRESPVFRGVPMPTDGRGNLTGQTPLPLLPTIALLESIVPAMTDEEEERLLQAVIRERHAVGLTSIRDLNLYPRAMRAYMRLRRKGALTLRVSMGLAVWDDIKIEEALAEWGLGPTFGDEWLRVDSIGEMLSPIAARSQVFTNVALTANRYGWRLSPGVHGGSRDLDVALDAFEAADRERTIVGRRWVLEHVPVATGAQLDRIARLGVVASVQYLGYAGGPSDERDAGLAPPVRSLIDRGIIVSAGSDFQNGPTSSDNPFIPIYFYVTRKTSSGQIVDPSQKISRAEALRVSTYNYAYETFEEKLKGSIEPGKLADFLILSDDVLTVPEGKILSIRPLATYVGGRQVYGEANNY